MAYSSKRTLIYSNIRSFEHFEYCDFACDPEYSISFIWSINYSLCGLQNSAFPLPGLTLRENRMFFPTVFWNCSIKSMFV